MLWFTKVQSGTHIIMFDWLFRHRRTSTLSPEALGQIIDSNVALARRFDAATAERHRHLTAEFVTSKHWFPHDDLELTDEILVTIAANAVIPILNLHPWLYRMVSEIVVWPTADRRLRTTGSAITGALGEGVMSAIGEATPNSGPVAIAWDSARWQSRNPHLGENVVIHELCHKLDMSDGYSDGLPPLRGEGLEVFAAIFHDEFEHVDDRPSDDVLRPYAWTNRAEFFAVTSEMFFCVPQRLKDARPHLYEALSSFFMQDPATDWAHHQAGSR